MDLTYPVRILSQLPNDPKYVGHEKSIKKYWKQNKVHKFVVLEQQHNEDEFIFMDGPPFCSGNLHMGHLFIGGLKDSVLRYHTMHGKRCKNLIGYDTHGLPVESAVMKKLGLNTSADVDKLGLVNFNNACKRMILDCENSWEPIYDSIGRWADFSKVYKTMDVNFMETVWWIYSEMSKKGLTYKGYKVMPFSTYCETPLSNFEAGLNYKEKSTNSVYVSFKITSERFNGVNLVAWSTTPWTLLSNIALCVGPESEYVMCEDDKGNKYIVSKESVDNLKLTIVSVTSIGLGKDLVGLEYEPLFNFLDFKYHKVLADAYVKGSAEIGTGIVHIAPAHGEDDCRICLENNILTSKDLLKVCLVNYQGKYIDNTGEYQGMYVFDADKKIIKNLKEQYKIVRIQEYRHQYPYCYRGDTPLLYMAVSSYFVEVSKIKDKLVEMNDKITWTKKEIGENRFKNWIENAKDWCVSRNRFFGTPIPVWESEDGEESVTIGSIDELVDLAGLDYRPTDIHLESVKDIQIISKSSGKVLRNNGLIMDCWFESGSVPYGQIHYPFENSDAFDNKDFLSDFVAEGIDQTRGWFYTLLVISSIISNKPPFKTVMCSGTILDEKGQKISKKYGNFVDPNTLIDEYGADTLRLMLLKSPLINGEPLLFKTSDAKDVFQKMTPYVNAVKLFLENYINSQKRDDPIVIEYLGDIVDYPTSSFTMMDLWILEKVYLLRVNIEKLMEEYKIDFVVREIIDFVDDLANWYVKFNRHRLKGLKGKDDYENSLSVLFTVLFDYCIITAPFMPFLSEHIYQHLSALIFDDKNCTVHLEGYPESVRPHNVTESFTQLQKLSKMIRYVRETSKTHMSTKTPIKKCTIYYNDDDVRNSLQCLVPLIESEINCQVFEYIKMENDDMLVYTIKPNFKEIGQSYGKDSKLIVELLTKLSKTTLRDLYNHTQTEVVVNIRENNVVLNSNHFEILIAIEIDEENTNIKNIGGNGMLVSIDMTYDEESHNCYQLKNLMSFVQKCRKDMELNPWNKIMLKYSLEKENNAFEKLLETCKLEIEHKLGTGFVKTNLVNNARLYDEFTEFGKKNQVNVLISIEKVIDV